jgi:glycerophosphoryl diester phosphodiesterase
MTPMTFFETGRILNLAHRGASAVAPQNTLAAFERAAALGADGVELDVRLSSDAVPVVIHDATVDATTDGSGRVAAMTLARLKRLDAGAWFDPAFAGERIPTLEEVLEAFGDRLLLNIELKSAGLRDDALERAVAALIKQHDVSERVLVSCFNPLALRRIKQLAPHLPVGLLTAAETSFALRRRWSASIAPHEARHPEHTIVDADYIVWARQHGYRVVTWTVDEPDEMRRLIDLGVDGIITNVPDVLRRVMGHLA